MANKKTTRAGDELRGNESGGKSGLPVHDSLFKHLLTRTDTALHFLRDRLPPRLVQYLADAPPQILPGSFVDEHLRPSQTDLLLRVQLKRRWRPVALLSHGPQKSTRAPCPAAAGTLHHAHSTALV